MKTLRRISFVIYSCEKDTFQKQFDLIRSKAKDFLSGYSSNVLLESEALNNENKTITYTIPIKLNDEC